MDLRVLLIDDDTRLAELLRDYLGPSGVHLAYAPGGREGLAELAGGAFDAVLLDVMMPGMDGLETLRAIRARSGVPVLMLTARGDESDRVVGLEMGADDYIPKPFSPRELLARIRAVLRRGGARPTTDQVRAGALSIEPSARRARVGGTTLTLTALEFDLLVALARRAGRTVSRRALLESAGRDDVHVSERAVDVHISHLRRKLAADPAGAGLIETVRGVGYVLRGEADA